MNRIEKPDEERDHYGYDHHDDNDGETNHFQKSQEAQAVKQNKRQDSKHERNKTLSKIVYKGIVIRRKIERIRCRLIHALCLAMFATDPTKHPKCV